MKRKFDTAGGPIVSLPVRASLYVVRLWLCGPQSQDLFSEVLDLAKVYNSSGQNFS
jgi:hypothetical protein